MDGVVDDVVEAPARFLRTSQTDTHRDLFLQVE